MSDQLPAGWDLPSTGDDAPSSSASAPTGVWDVDMVVNPQTSIACVDLPHFSNQRPLQGTKPARKSILKLLAGMFNDVCPLNFRDKTEADQVTSDPYHKVAPGWSSLSGGRKPFVMIKPAELAEKLTRVGRCVPMVRAVRLFVVDGAQGKRSVTLEELVNMNIEIQNVPNMYRHAAAASNGGGPSAAPAPPAEVVAMAERQDALQAQLSKMEKLLSQLAAAANASAAAPPAAMPPATAAPAGASASSAAPAAATAPAHNVEEDDAPAGRRSKKARVE